jgi:hypothetical protein
MALTKKSKFKYWVAPFGFSNRFHAGMSSGLPSRRPGQTRLGWSVVIGLMRSRPGNIHWMGDAPPVAQQLQQPR